LLGKSEHKERERKREGGRLFITFMDLRKAYDSVPWRKAMWMVLKKLGVPEVMFGIIKFSPLGMCESQHLLRWEVVGPNLWRTAGKVVVQWLLSFPTSYTYIVMEERLEECVSD